MFLRRIAVENVRSFLGRTELFLDGPVSILIGPNGGGKTNLLDIAVILLRRYLFASMYPAHAPTADQEERYQFRPNDALNAMTLERHSNGAGKPQLVEIEIEVTERDCKNMIAMKREASELIKKAEKKYTDVQIGRAERWDVEKFSPGDRFTYRWNGSFNIGARASSGRGQGKHAAGPRTTSSPNRAVATGERSGPATLAHRTRLDP
jgi:putative ATP-dependent endonuclease of the OLD family